MDDICKIKVKKFNFRKGGPPQLGVIAQDIQKIFPSLVTEDPETGNLSVKYSIFNTMLSKCVQEQQEMITTHKEVLDTQQTTIETLEADLANTRSTLNAQQTTITSLEEELATTQSTLNAQQTTITSLEEELATTQSTLVDVLGRLSDLEAKGLKINKQ
jgi:chromosome segregation ATPase